MNGHAALDEKSGNGKPECNYTYTGRIIENNTKSQSPVISYPL